MSSPRDAVERHRAPALWLVVVALAAVCVVAVLVGTREALAVLAGTLVSAAVARLVGRGRRPDGVAVRSTWVDVLVMLVLAAGIVALMFTPGV